MGGRHGPGAGVVTQQDEAAGTGPGAPRDAHVDQGVEAVVAEGRLRDPHEAEGAGLSSVEVAPRVDRVGPPRLEEVRGGVLLVNPADSQATINYNVNGNVYVMEPGMTQRLPAGGVYDDGQLNPILSQLGADLCKVLAEKDFGERFAAYRRTQVASSRSGS